MGKPASQQHGTPAMYARGCRCDHCKAARAAYIKARNSNPDAAAKKAAYFREWHLKNKERRNRERRERYHANKPKELAMARKHLYGLTEAAYQTLLAAQGGACAICRAVPTDSFHVDHDHSCCPGIKTCGNCIRGLLCARCNHAIGLMRDDPAILRSAAEYIERQK